MSNSPCEHCLHDDPEYCINYARCKAYQGWFADSWNKNAKKLRKYRKELSKIEIKGVITDEDFYKDIT